jgi:hypothetical protein
VASTCDPIYLLASWRGDGTAFGLEAFDGISEAGRVDLLTRETNDGFGDPVLGLRYSLPQPMFGWDSEK